MPMGEDRARQRLQRVSSPRPTIILSEHYTRLVGTNPAFRTTPVRKECRPVTDPTLHQSCAQSFDREAAADHNGNTHR